MLNDDVTQVEFKEFHSTDESNYPSFTFCFPRPVLMPEQFGEFGEEYDGKEQELISNWTYRRSEYLEYLNGNLKPEYKELFANLDYDKMTHSLEDYMKLEAGLGAKRGRAGRGTEYKTYTRLRWAFPNRTQTLSRAYRQKKNDKGRKYIDNLNEEQKAKIPMVDFYISERSANLKCYSFNIPFIRNEKIHRFRLDIHPSLLHKTCLYVMDYINRKMEGQLGIKYINDSRTYPKFHNWFDHHTVYFHYPNQRYTSNFFSTIDAFNPEIEWAKYYTRKYYVANVEVLKRRNKPSKPCIDGHYDHEVVRRSLDTFDCGPPKFKSGNQTPDCETNKQNLEFEDGLYEYPSPCLSLKSINEWHSEANGTEWYLDFKKRNKNVKETYAHEIYFEDEYYKKLTHIQSFCWETLVGNTGGYIGLFLGYTILQAPWLFLEFVQMVSTTIQYIRFRREKEEAMWKNYWGSNVLKIQHERDSDGK